MAKPAEIDCGESAPETSIKLLSLSQHQYETENKAIAASPIKKWTIEQQSTVTTSTTQFCQI
ncbi:MAG: hypothetical protein GY782_04470 [Gammaproteobacteria bacterium]|nr:hypothetical protein [Gammaproteobacteria bacterium]